jgi:hypothetical protein
MELAPQEYRSLEINQIMMALAKAQGAYKPLVANEKGPRGMYANLAAMIASTREALSGNGLAFYQYDEITDDGAGAILMKSIIGHESGQWLSSIARIVKMETERDTGRIVEVIRRRQAMMLLGIAPSENDPTFFDDDGEEQAESFVISQVRKPRTTKPEVNRNDVVNPDQYQELLIELEGYEDIAKDIMQCYNIETLADLPREEYHKSLMKIRRIKRTQEEYEKQKSR